MELDTMRTILLVEDEVDIRDLISEVLRAEGYSVLVASNGAEILKVLQSLKNGHLLLITDYQLPDMNGYVLVAEVLKQFPSTVAICTSGNFTEYDSTWVPECTLLPKPFTFKKLLQTIKESTEKRDATI
jgi:CheY-like chemotaxis protein